MEYLEKFQQEEFAHLKSEYKDTAKLRAYFEERLLRSQASDKDMVAFKQKFGVSDEAMLTVLMGIIKKTAAKTEWQWGKSREDSYDVNWSLLNAVKWLGVCADTETKQFLMDIITDNGKLFDFRAYAILAYMKRADVKETRDAIVRFLADDVRTALNEYSSVYRLAIQVYDKAENDTQTHEAIATAMSAALAKEENKEAFAKADKLLAERSKEYAESPQRKAALERMNKPPEPKTP